MTSIENTTIEPITEGYRCIVRSIHYQSISFLIDDIQQFPTLYRRCEGIFAKELVNEVDLSSREEQYLLCPEDQQQLKFVLRPLVEVYDCYGVKMAVAGENGQYAAYHLFTGAVPLGGYYKLPQKAKVAASRKLKSKKEKLASALNKLDNLNLLIIEPHETSSE